MCAIIESTKDFKAQETTGQLGFLNRISLISVEMKFLLWGEFMSVKLDP